MSSLRNMVLLLSLSLLSESEQSFLPAFAPSALPHVLFSSRKTSCAVAPTMCVAPHKERIEVPDCVKLPTSRAPSTAQGAWNCDGGVCRPRGISAPASASPQLELRSGSSPLAELLGADLELINCATKHPASLSSLPSSGVIAVYFSAHWCAPCQRFEQKLLETYASAQRENKPMEVVMVCADRKEEEYAQHTAGIPWHAVSWAQKSKLGTLMARLSVGGIPSLVLLDAATGDVITRNGRKLLAKDPLALNYPWNQPADAAPTPAPSPSRSSIRPPLPHRRFAPIGRGMPPLPITPTFRAATALASSSSCSAEPECSSACSSACSAEAEPECAMKLSAKFVPGVNSGVMAAGNSGSCQLLSDAITGAAFVK